MKRSMRYAILWPPFVLWILKKVLSIKESSGILTSLRIIFGMTAV